MRLSVNGLEHDVHYDAHAIDDLIVPLLTRWVQATDDGRRHWAFLAAAPGTGKSTLATLVERAMGGAIQSLGMDGFHHPQAYLESHTTTDAAGNPITLASIKGAPESFDAEGLAARIRASAHHDVGWPVYDRTLHDVRPDAQQVTGKHLLLEGNWLLLDEPRWAGLRELAEVSIFISAPEDLLRERLVGRKQLGGSSLEQATAFYEHSDGPNVRRALSGSALDGVDLHLHMSPDGTLHESAPL